MKMDTRVQVRSNKKLKEEAVALLENMGLDLTTAVNMLLRQIVNRKELPFTPTATSFDDAALATLNEPTVAVVDDKEFERLLSDA